MTTREGGSEPKLIHEMLECFGQYGYGTGWKNAPYCQDCCVRSQQCLEATCGGPVVKAVLVEQNRRDGLSDRIEGTSRHGTTGMGAQFTSVPRR
jgi:hypothetical protein